MAAYGLQIPKITVYNTLNADGLPILQLGGYGSKNGQFNNPESIALASDGSIWATDNDNARLQHFKVDGTFIAAIPTRYGNSPYYPSGMAIAADDSLWVTDIMDGKLFHLKGNGQLIQQFVIDRSSSLYDPVGIAVAADGSLWVANSIYDNVKHFNSNGVMVGQLGDGKIVYTEFHADTGNLDFRDVLVNDQHYWANLTDQGGLRFMLKGYGILQNQYLFEKPVSEFNPNSGKLTIPALRYNGFYYQAVLQMGSDGIFSVQSVTPL